MWSTRLHHVDVVVDVVGVVGGGVAGVVGGGVVGVGVAGGGARVCLRGWRRGLLERRVGIFY